MFILKALRKCEKEPLKDNKIIKVLDNIATEKQSIG